MEWNDVSDQEMNRIARRSRRWAGAAGALVLSACAPIVPTIPPPLNAATSVKDGSKLPSDAAVRELLVSAAPKPPVAAISKTEPSFETRPGNDPVLAATTIQQLPLPTFIQLVYAELLKKNVNLHPAVVSRQDLVTFRTGEGQTASQLEQAVRLLLKSYGVSAVDVGGLVRVVPDNAALGDLPAIQFGSASPDVPLPLRPVFHLLTLQAVRQVDVTNWLRTMFGDRVTVMEDAGRNAVLLRGNPDNVKAALEAVAVLDQPVMKGRASLALTPAYWSAEELAKRLSDVLSAEGYAIQAVGTSVVPGAARSPVILLPIAALNVVYVFASTDAVADHVSEWARTLDRPNERGVGKNIFTYQVKHKDAELLAVTLDSILSGTRTATSTAAPAAGGTATPTSGSTRLSTVVVDKSTNVLIFQAKPEDYGQIATLLQTLDRPTKAALIEVTVAELSHDDSRSLGVEWLSSHVDGSGGYKASSLIGDKGVVGGGLGSAGLSYRIFNGAGAMRAAVNALASSNRATILSSPRLMARNGEAATIQVGQDVPIITSQQTGVSSGATNGVLQSVQYRTTGVILKIKPVIHSGDQVDLDITQEVSEAGKTETGVTSSPTFKTRKVDTKLTLRNGATVLLGGLISETGSQGNAGVPFLKDLPLIGSLFSTQSRGGDRRELIVLITPYIANDAHDAETITEAFRKSLGDWANRARPTLERKDDGSWLNSKPATPVQPAAPASAPGK